MTPAECRPSLGGAGATPAWPGVAGRRAVALWVWAPTPGEGQPRVVRLPGVRRAVSPCPPRLPPWSRTVAAPTAVSEAVRPPSPGRPSHAAGGETAAWGASACPELPSTRLSGAVLSRSPAGPSMARSSRAGVLASVLDPRQRGPGPVHGHRGPLRARAHTRLASRQPKAIACRGRQHPRAPRKNSETLRHVTHPGRPPPAALPPGPSASW